MPEHLLEEQIARYRGRQTSPEELLRIDDHISGCARCRELLAMEVGAASRGGNTSSLPVQPASSQSPNTAAWRKPTRKVVTLAEHLSFEQLEAFVDRKMSKEKRDAVKAHIEECQECREDLRDLNTFKAELQSSREASWWRRFSRVRFVRGRAIIAMAVVVVLAVAVGRSTLWHHHAPQPVIVANSHGTEPGQTEPNAGAGYATAKISEFAELSPSERSRLENALSEQRIQPADILAQLQGRTETLLGPARAGPRLDLLHPVGEVVREERPVFRWQPLAGADRFVVTIFDQKMNLVETSPPLHAGQWRPLRRLQRGQIYLWQVNATLRSGESVISPAPPNPEARFQVLDQEKWDELIRIQGKLPRDPSVSRSELHLLNGILYAQAGLLELGEEELEQIPTGDPNYNLAESLLKSVQEIRRANR